MFVFTTKQIKIIQTFIAEIYGDVRKRIAKKKPNRLVEAVHSRFSLRRAMRCSPKKWNFKGEYKAYEWPINDVFWLYHSSISWEFTLEVKTCFASCLADSYNWVSLCNLSDIREPSQVCCNGSFWCNQVSQHRKSGTCWLDVPKIRRTASWIFWSCMDVRLKRDRRYLLHPASMVVSLCIWRIHDTYVYRIPHTIYPIWMIHHISLRLTKTQPIAEPSP